MSEPQEEYHVEWTIDLPADSPRAAAEAARSVQRNPLSWAVVFTVTDSAGSTVEIDLLDDDPDDRLRTWVITTALGDRRWQAEDEQHAREQHKDAFPDEDILSVTQED